MTSSFQQIADELKTGIVSPAVIQEYRNFLAGWMYSLNAEYGRLQAEGATWQTEHQEEYKSQAACERAWEATEDGQKAIMLKYKIRGIEHLQDALTAQHYALIREQKETGGEG